ncbi:DUF4058 family protein [Microcoleus sp. FACHB-SPT15]|uniref:DUF4058 family protein n=1 Tax=Microcoleus sp. FACHB-SPT15 TaxID=2692830 RepID=UPI00177F39E8|nr:DUF4058 family protein [Microcoleus sp. FACHB-SPT15]MBD1808981.1 DUF4058 family protein [Microcoleus sp. FACHB-SPT15]
MLSPFPGMNPYLEHHALWPEVHHWLITLIAESLVPKLRPKYRVAIEKRVYQASGEEDTLLVGIPDVTVQRSQTATNSTTQNVAVATPPLQSVTVTIPMPETVRESYLEVREVATREVVCAIEVLSRKNKRTGEGRKAYKKNRQRVLGSSTHLVEIDLLRAGEPMPILENGIQSDYRILVSQCDRRPSADLYAFNLQNAIPSFPLPLRKEDTEPLVDLQELLNGVYDRAGYDLVIDYSHEPVPPLKESDAAWADVLLREKGLR